MNDRRIRPRCLSWPAQNPVRRLAGKPAHARLDHVRLFCLPAGAPPAEWWVRLYLTAPESPPEPDGMRRTVMPPAPTVEEALAGIVREWRPHIVHTLGFDPASHVYLRARNAHGLAGIGRWVPQARGGPDIALQRYSPDFLPQIRAVLANCDHFIPDNQQNYEYARNLGLTADKAEKPGMGVVSGPGGLDLKSLRARWTLPPSKRERLIVWPKAYEVISAKAMPVFEQSCTRGIEFAPAASRCCGWCSRRGHPAAEGKP